MIPPESIGRAHPRQKKVYRDRFPLLYRGAEQVIFAHLDNETRPGHVSFTATCWGKPLQQKKLPAGAPVPTAGDCYRFVLSNPLVDACLMAGKTWPCWPGIIFANPTLGMCTDNG